jgi:hypothetical protein
MGMSADGRGCWEGGSGLQARGLDRNQCQRGERWAIFQGRFSRDGCPRAWAPPPAGCRAVMRQGKVQAETGALMAAAVGVGEWCDSRREGRARSAAPSGLP